MSAPLPDDAVLEALVAELEAAVARGEPVDAAAVAVRRGVAAGLVEDCLAGLRALTGPAAAGPGGAQRLGPYELLALLGRGGMGAVYRARHPQLDREVAVKVLRGGAHATEQERARFLREAQALAALRHPNVLTIHDAGQSAAGAYLVLELVAGARPISAAAAGLDWRGRVALARDAARGLGYAHARGVIHRDVKPENLLVDPEGRVRVSDFGLARLARSERLTETGALVGTLAYMAPEQASGDVARHGPAADVWGLGAVLLELLTGRTPCAGVGPDADLASLRAADPGLPRDLEAVLRRALAPDPDARQPHGDALGDDLDALLAGRRPPGLDGPARTRPVSRAATALATGLALAAALAWRLAPAEPARTTPGPTGRTTPGPIASTTPVGPAAPTEEEAPWRAAASGASGASGAADAGAEALAARRWLGAHASDRRAGRARALLAEGRRAPLCVLAHTEASAPVHVAFDGPDALVTAGDGWLRRWSLPDGAALRAWRVAPLEAFLRLPDGDWLLAGGGAAERWPASALRGDPGRGDPGGEGAGPPSGRPGDARRAEQGAVWVARLPGAGGGPVVASPDGRRLAVAAGRAGVHVLDAADGGRRTLGTPGDGTPRRLAFTTDARLVVAREREGAAYTLELWDVERGELLAALPALAVSALATLPGGRLALGSHRGTVTLHDAATLAIEGGLEDPASAPWVYRGDEAVGQLELLPGGAALLALPGRDVPAADRTLKRLALAGGGGAVTPPLAAPCAALAVGPDGCLAAVGRRDGRAEVWLLPP